MFKGKARPRTNLNLIAFGNSESEAGRNGVAFTHAQYQAFGGAIVHACRAFGGGTEPGRTGGGFLEMVGSREMLRLGDELEASSDGRYFKLTESWKPGNFDKHLYAQA